ncbi:hypothetical protein SAMD00079811_62040 [Scytonema sp. HK-05]|nr:hypothetical protein SAMD00079811_62040 [Scytonema sp. HK-05]
MAHQTNYQLVNGDELSPSDTLRNRPTEGDRIDFLQA